MHTIKENYTSDDDIFFAVYICTREDREMVALANEGLLKIRERTSEVYAPEFVDEATVRLYNYLHTYKRAIIEQWQNSTLSHYCKLAEQYA